MEAPVPKIRTDDQSSQVTPVPNSSGTSEQDPSSGPVLFSPSLGGEQVRQGGTSRLAELVEQRRRVRQEMADCRAEFAAARRAGLGRRHAARLRHLAERRPEPTDTTETEPETR